MVGGASMVKGIPATDALKSGWGIKPGAGEILGELIPNHNPATSVVGSDAQD